MRDIHVSASILSCDFSRLKAEIENVQSAGVDRIHVDVMDGHFVPNITIGPVIVSAVRRVTNLPIEAHLMIENPWDYINAFADAGADVIQIQTECYGVRRMSCRGHGQYPKEIDAMDEDVFLRDIRKIQAKGKKAFGVINPGTPVCFSKSLGILDGILVMSVNPGFAGQSFMPEVLDKVKTLRKSFTGDIEIDGGINQKTYRAAREAGVNLLVTASYLFQAPDQTAAVALLKS